MPRDISSILPGEDDYVVSGSDTEAIVVISGIRYKLMIRSPDSDGLIELFSVSVTRRVIPVVLERLARAYMDTVTVGGARLSRLMRMVKMPESFAGVLDFFKTNVDKGVGFPGEGYLPAQMDTRAPEVIRSLWPIVTRWLSADNSYDYLCVDRPSGWDVYHLSDRLNPLGQPRMKSPRRMRLYTGANGAINMAIISPEGS